jgi:hypothetical protein
LPLARARRKNIQKAAMEIINGIRSKTEKPSFAEREDGATIEGPSETT